MRDLFFTTLVLLSPVLVVADDIDEATGLIKNPGWEMVRIHCGGCHSTRAGHRTTRGPPDLARHNSLDAGDAELMAIRSRDGKLGILDYLAANYPPQPNRRRAPIPPSLLPQNL